MPIQFRCESCSQPIEVDDDGAGQWVACPFCSETSRAPASSDPNIRFDVPVAPPQVGSGPDAFGGVPVPATGAEPRRCVLGWIALACLGVCVLCLCLLMSIVIPIVLDLGANPDPAAAQKLVIKHQSTHPWMILPNLLSVFAAVAALPLAIVSLVRRESPRWPAIVTLVISVGMVALMCLGFFMALAMAPGA